MKRLITLLILLLSISQLKAQRDLTERRPVWFGVNMGGTWQTSDMKPQAGIGWGFTVARYSRISNPSPLYWGWRARFLDGRNFGYNYHPLYGIKANPVLSGYHSGTDPDTGHVFSNYKMRYDEFAFEIVLGSNTLRKHGVLLYGWGGAGMTYWKTSTNLTDASGNFYDYSTVNMTGNEDLVKADLDGMLDDTYETNALGSGTAGQWGFMPSAGIGFGYQWSNFAIVAEHKTTWALNDLIDGTNHNGAGAATGNNDIYHYDGLTLKWNFNSQHNTNDNTTPPPPAPDFTQMPPPQNPNPTPDPVVNPAPNPNPNPNPQTPTLQPPTVQFTTPNVDPYVTTVLNQNLVVRITNITSSNQIVLTINNQVNNNFSFNPNTQTMTFQHTLQAGNNVYKVVATNAAGSAQDVQTITYKGQTDPSPTPPTALPPTVTITSPSTDPYTSATSTYSVTATVTNVPNAAAITVTRNGSPITNFSYNQQTNKVTFVANLQSGSNLYKIVGTNSVGTASDQVTIIHGNTNSGVQPPVVTITTPTPCPYSTRTQAQAIAATITNVSQASQVTVVFNNQAITNFTFTPAGANANISFNVQLVAGANPFTITGTNTAGTDAESCTITYKTTTAPVVPPDVNITTPSTSPFATSNASFTLKATVLNVNSSSEISVSSNNALIVGWTYDMNTKELTYNTTLQQGTTNFVVTATNANGTDNDNQSVTYQPHVPVVLPPTVNITNPRTSPFTATTPAQTINATVMNVTQQSQITVRSSNNTNIPFTFNANSHEVIFNVTLAVGTTTFTVSATNTAGNASDQVTLKYDKGSSTPGNGGGSTTTPGGPTTTQSGEVGRPPQGSPPSIDLHVPSMSPVSTGAQQFPITMIVTGVASVSDIVVKVNSVVITSGVTYNASSGTLSFTASLVQGQNGIQVRATNANGQDNQSLVVNYTAGSRIGQDPEPKQTAEPKKDEPKKSEPAKEEPKKPEPKKVESTPAKKADPPKEEPKKAETKPAPAPEPTPAPSRGTTAPTGTPRPR